MLHSTLPLVQSHRPGGPVLRLSVPRTTHQLSLAAVSDERVTLLMMILYALAHPALGLKQHNGARLETEQYFWRGGVVVHRFELLRVVHPIEVVYHVVLVDPAFDLDLALSNI